jgi:diguanylate cyclase (GGDEF)-like protein
VAGHAFEAPGGSLSLTISIGVATAPSEEAGTVASLIREADKALYRAKSAGRDRTA